MLTKFQFYLMVIGKVLLIFFLAFLPAILYMFNIVTNMLVLYIIVFILYIVGSLIPIKPDSYKEYLEQQNKTDEDYLEEHKKIEKVNIMFSCPICGKNGITFYGKMRAGPFTPSKCQYCGEYVITNSNLNGIFAGIETLWLFVSFILLFLTSFWLGIIAFFAGHITLEIIRTNLVQLLPYKKED